MPFTLFFLWELLKSASCEFKAYPAVGPDNQCAPRSVPVPTPTTPPSPVVSLTPHPLPSTRGLICVKARQVVHTSVVKRQSSVRCKVSPTAMEDSYHRPDQKKLQTLKDIANKLRIESIDSTTAAGSGWVSNHLAGIFHEAVNLSTWHMSPSILSDTRHHVPLLPRSCLSCFSTPCATKVRAKRLILLLYFLYTRRLHYCFHIAS